MATTHDIALKRFSQRMNLTDMPFWLWCSSAITLLILLVLGMLAADVSYTTPGHLWHALQTPEIRAAIRLSLLTSIIATVLALILGVPTSYLLTRGEFRGKVAIETLLTLPLALPPVVVGISLLLLFQSPIGQSIQRIMPVTYTPIAVVLAQLPIACALVVRSLRICFSLIPLRQEQVAWTLGSSRSTTFWRIVLPQARRSMFSAAALAWARSLGEFGSVLVFAGATRMRTEVLSTTVYLEMSVGKIEAALAAALLMVALAVSVLILVRFLATDTAITDAC
ncbi:MAG TPA: ABC transporter permease subunit [Armatimonadota bacterium]|nr:ABC transporter permease subunit [Armatimonadota bacterium]